MINRRDFLQRSIVGVSTFLIPASLLKGQLIERELVGVLLGSPNTVEYRKIAEFGLQMAKSQGASFADIRFENKLQEEIKAINQLSPQCQYRYSEGIGVRVVVEGCMGFVSQAGTPTEALVEVLITKAITIARATATLKAKGLRMAPQEALGQVAWKTPIQKNVFEVPQEEKYRLLAEVNSTALSHGASYVESQLFAQREWKYLATTDESFIQQELYQFWPTFVVASGDVESHTYQTRKALSTPVARGYEYLQKDSLDKIRGTVVRYKSSYDMVEDAKLAAQQVSQLQKAKSVEAGQYDLVIDPVALGSIIHHTIGKALNMDLIAGDEIANGASSFINIDRWKTGDKALGSRYVNFIADRTQVGALTTRGYDDEGIKAKQINLVKEGIIETFLTDRTKNQLIEENRSSGCGVAESWDTPVRCHMPTISLAPGKSPLTVDELIGQVNKGIWVIDIGEVSIDQQGVNFQVTAPLCYEIENGVIKGLLKDVAFQSTTKDFWNACTHICDRRDYRIVGTLTTTLGQKKQRLAASHGTATSRFNGIQVINTSALRVG